MSQQDPAFRSEYEAYSARRAAEGLPKVSYRNFLRQWRRSEEGHAARGDPPLETGGKGGKGGVTPPPPPPKRRQGITEGGDAPPAVKVKGGDTPPTQPAALTVQPSIPENQARQASSVLEAAGYPAFPDHIPTCGGSIADINQGRLTVAATKKLIDGLTPCTEPTTEIADALMHSLLRKRRGLSGEELLPRLGKATSFPNNWYRFEFKAPNSLQAGAENCYVEYHGTHLECLHAILSTGRLLPSNPEIPGTRSFIDRHGVYLHKPLNRHLAENYSSLTRYGTKHIFVKPCVEVVYDIRGSLKAGKQTNQVIQDFDSVQIASDQAGSMGRLATVDETTMDIVEWLGAEGSLGSFREDSKNPESPMAFSISKGLAACLRHNHKPRIHVTAAGWAKLSDVLSWPRIEETSATAGDVLEVVRNNKKQRYQLGLQQDGTYFIRAVQGHSRAEVGEENLLEPVSEENLPDTLLHGTSWNAYESIQQRGLIPGRAQTTGGKGGRKGGKWREGRQHVHFFSDAGDVSGQREGSTMLVRISTRKASEQGVRFLISRNGVYLTPDEVPPLCITSFQSLRTGDLYDRDGERIPRTG
ncbi:tRNA 2'-phosphotransferase 1 [Symbiodinium microadriaticum]|uniref:2'-phosphotransferase n=1 Tax=Symbiodinium microadriaticum TaxID=2951 RepID=A0A1Q9D952_SYMMI|nr:tRNA 2'-phosphotransferase 1 [Symbiodinium microadriaticum]